MGTHEIQNISAIRPTNTNVNIGNSTSIGVGGVGNVLIGDYSSTTGSNGVSLGIQNICRLNSVAIGKETIAGTSATVVGYRSSSGNNSDSVVLGHDNVSSGVSADIVGVNRTNNQANSLLLGNGSYTNIRANSTCDLGTAAVPFHDIYSNSSLIGTNNTRTVDSIVSCPATVTSNNLPSFNGTSGVVLQDSGIVSSNVIT